MPQNMKIGLEKGELLPLKSQYDIPNIVQN